MANSSGYPVKDMQARHLANMLEKPMRVTCALCPGWKRRRLYGLEAA